MDGASVVGLIASTIELTRLTKGVVQRLKSFVEATEDVPEALQVLHRRLPLLSLTLKAIQEQIGRDESLQSEAAEIANVVKPCAGELTSLNEKLQDLLPDSSDSRSVRLKKAIRSLKADSKIQASVKIIGSYLDDLASYNSAQAISKNDQKTDRVLELSTQTVSITSQLQQLQQSVVALASKPSLLRGQLDNEPNGTCEGLVVQNDNGSLLPAQRHAYIIQGGGISLANRCSCWSMKSKVINRQNYEYHRAVLSHKISNSHLPSCPLYSAFRDSKQASIRLRFTKFLLQRALDLTLTCKYGAGGFSISSNLDLKGVMRIDSPVSDLIEECFRCDIQLKYVNDFDLFRTKIVRLFQDGKASPTELNTKGQSIAFACIERTAMSKIHSERDILLLVSFLETLDALGVPLNERSKTYLLGHRDSVTCLDLIMYKLNYMSYRLYKRRGSDIQRSVSSIVDLGAQMTPSLMSSWYEIPLMTHVSDYAELSNCNKLHQAVLARSLSGVGSVVRTDSGSLHERTIGGLHVLHLAVEWPEGTKLLLDLGANINAVDDYGKPPLWYAIRLLCPETVEILLAARSGLNYEYRNVTGLSFSLLFDEASIYDTAIFAQLIRALAARRKEMASYAQKILPEQVLQDLHIDQNTVPDLEAMELFRYLEDRGHQIDRHYFDITDKSVYSHHPLGGRTMQIAFDAGFTNIDHPMVKDRALLQILCGSDKRGSVYLSREHILWWNEKGVDLTRPLLCPSFRDDHMLIIHSFSIRFGHNVRYDHILYDADSTRQTFQCLLDPKYMSCKDSCRCLCSIDGCTPLTNLLKSIFDRNTSLSSKAVHITLSVLGLDVKNSAPAVAIQKTVTSAIIRLLLFKALGLRHLCCHSGDRFDPLKPALEKDEADEITEEDKDLVEEFHILLPRALQDWEHSALSLWDFWVEFYEEHIQSKQESIDEEYVKAVEDLGVRIEEM